MKQFYFFAIIILYNSFNLFAQTPSSSRLASFQKIKTAQSPLDGIPFRNIGPTIMSGRVTDIEINPENPTEFYVAYASGGVWHSTNNGQTLNPIFDHEATLTIGDMAMDWKSKTLWVGTGEVNSSRSSYAGTGIYKTNDTGKTWKHLGLDESHHIGKIIVHPNNPNIAWVAVLGHLYTKNNERGIYKTTDGGKSWSNTLYVNDTTGCVDLMIDPSNAETLYATAWTRTRTAWNFNGSGLGSGIYKSIDGGNDWKLITNGDNGFPSGNGVGRIGMAICKAKPSTLYAMLDNNFKQEKKKDDKLNELKPKDFLTMSKTDFQNLDEKKLKKYLKNNGYPEKYTPQSLKASISKNEFKIKDIGDWKLGDADNNLFDTEIIGAELYRSDDAGKTWRKTNTELMEGVVFTYGYYFGTIAVSPSNPEKVIVAGYTIIASDDGGNHFKEIAGANCHADYHRVWINPLNENHIIVGNDGGVNITYDAGANWLKANNPAVGQFYTIQVDEAKPYNVYGGLQDNGTWTAKSNTKESNAWQQEGQNSYKNIGDGDGMQVQVDSRDNETVYVGYQFGNYFRTNKNTMSSTYIEAVNDIGQKSYRFNWQTPICLSKHNQDIFYLGSNHFHRSLQKGDLLASLSDDLTTTKMKGNVPFGTLTTISESPKKFGLIYVGTDDGNIQCSKDVGSTWTKISNQLPQNLWVTRVIASAHKESRVFASLNGYRNDDFKPYLFESENYGKTWKAIGTDLPQEPINVIKEDPKDSNIIYVGTDNGLYVSFDKNHFIKWQSNLPRVAIHDIAIQARENDIVLGTHGRSIYISKLDWIQKYPSIKNEELYVFDLDSLTLKSDLGKKNAIYSEPRSLNLQISFYVKSDSDMIYFSIINQYKKIVKTWTANAIHGMNEYNYDLSLDENYALKNKIVKADDGKYYLSAGKYQLELKNKSNKKVTKTFVIKEKKEE